MTKDDFAARLDALRERVDAACRRSGRDPAQVALMAVSKRFPISAVETAIEAGQRLFGENRVQEAESKVLHTHALSPRVNWHMIGPLQRNKARRAAELFDAVQSVDRLSLAQALSNGARRRTTPLVVYLQVNIDSEPQKSGVAPADLPALYAAVGELPALSIAGLMAIPKHQPTPEAMRPAFARLRSLAEELAHSAGRSSPLLLSMGMSADFEIAVEEGAHCIRVGTALFGERPTD